MHVISQQGGDTRRLKMGKSSLLGLSLFLSLFNASSTSSSSGSFAASPFGSADLSLS